MQRSPLKLHDKSTVYGNTVDSHSQARDQAAWHVARMPGGSSLAEAEKFCRQIAKSHYENFSVCTCLVPERLRQDFANIYAFSRWSDDLGDESESAWKPLKNFINGEISCDNAFTGRPVIRYSLLSAQQLIAPDSRLSPSMI